MIKNCRSILAAAVVGAAALTAGCASGVSHHELAEVRATADEALRMANTADYHAHQAKIMAHEAMGGKKMHKRMKGMMK